MNSREFQELIWEHGRKLHRDMPWRTDTRPYFVLVSELMLQQTQVERVIPKFNLFIEMFPTIEDLAAASLADVLKAWSGLGYNRRAKFLHDAARAVVGQYDGSIPDSFEELVKLPGVGPNTAGAILAYSFNQPAVFVETNIRTVYFHHFFKDQTEVSDKELRVVVEQTLERENPREWYQALMDYGSWLKRQGSGRLDQSRHYKKQSPLKGSVREMRGLILKALASEDLSKETLEVMLPQDVRFERALTDLIKDGLIMHSGGRLHLPR